jgi:hypothetical protein
LSVDAIPNIAAMVSTFPQAQEQKSFGSFLQKRTFFLPKSLLSLGFFWGRDLGPSSPVRIYSAGLNLAG